MKVEKMKMIPKRRMITPKNMLAAMPATAGKMMRREQNHNLHVITHHGKIMMGRKGRKI